MPNHFATIGLPVQNQQEFEAIAYQAAKLAEAIPVKHGKYLRWSGDSGAELWIQQNRRGELIGLHPHFAGTSAMSVGLVHTVSREGDTPLDGALYAWAAPSEDDPQNGSYPFVFDLPNFLLYPNLSFPLTVTAQIAAFAHELQVYETVEAYNQEQQGTVKFASQSFIPAGLFTPNGPDPETPQAIGIFAGHVLKSERKINELSGQPFFWISVDSLGGIFDVVVSPELLSEAPPTGGVVFGTFWLSGSLTGVPLKDSVFKKLWSFTRRKE